MELNNYLSYNPNLLKSILLLVLAVSGNFVGNTLGCTTQYQMTHNMYLKHILLIFITFFTLNYTSEENEYPLKQIERAFLIWGAYLIFSKQNYIFTGLSSGFLVLTYILDTFDTYYQKKLENKNVEEKFIKENKEKINTINKFKNYSFKISILLIITGFGLYLKDKYIEYGDNFNILTYIFGKTTCKSLH